MSVRRVAFLLATLGAAQVSAAGAEEGARLGFRVAYLTESGLEFGAPGPIDWQALAPRAWAELDLEKPGDKVLEWLFARNQRDRGFAEVEFETSLVAGLEDSHYYYLGESGVREVEPLKMKGRVRFELDRMGTIGGRCFSGSVVTAGREGSIADPGGFVVDSRRPLVFIESRSSRRTRELVPPEVRDNWAALAPEARAFWTVEDQYAFRIRGEDTEYVFVKWAADDECYQACCGRRYWILAGSEALEQVAWSLSECDI